MRKARIIAKFSRRTAVASDSGIASAAAEPAERKLNLALLSFATVLYTGGAVAQEVDPEFGRELFQTYCWQCHGSDATGDGPMAEMLAISTPDLTQLSARNSGNFPTAKTAQKVDGRAPLLAHGGDMPIFGPVLESDQTIPLRLSDGQPMILPMPLADLVAYLKSIQSTQE